MGVIKDLINNIRYRLVYRRLAALPYDDQRKIGYQIYNELYTDMSRLPGEAIGGAIVMFQCDYEGHVTYYLKNLLEERCADTDDCTLTWSMRSVGEDPETSHVNAYELTVMARGSDETVAALVAEASAMSAILKIPTLYGNLQRSLVVANDDGAPIMLEVETNTI